MSFPDLSFVKSGKSILFLGAGFSADAINHAGEGVKDVGGLISQLLTSIGVDSSEGYDLDTAAQEFIDAFDGNAELELSKLIHDNFSAKNTPNLKEWSLANLGLESTQPTMTTWWRISTLKKGSCTQKRQFMRMLSHPLAAPKLYIYTAA